MIQPISPLRRNNTPPAELMSQVIHHMKYARYLKDLKRRESFVETVNRNQRMHLLRHPHLKREIVEAYDQVYKRRVLPSMRALQFSGDAILKNPARNYNCTALLINDLRAFREAFFLLLSGCGVGYSVQKQHVGQLPPLNRGRGDQRYLVVDTIEGWAMAVDAMVDHLWRGAPRPRYDFSDIRPQGSDLVTSGGKAPGHEELEKSLESFRQAFMGVVDGHKARPIDVHSGLCHISVAVLSGGVRRSAYGALFSEDDHEMLTCKMGDWWNDHPEFRCANNSVVLLRKGSWFKSTSRRFRKVWEEVKKGGSGEPGIFWTNDLDVISNPCVTGDTWVMTNTGPKQVRNLVGRKFIARVNGSDHETTDKGFWSTGNRTVYRLTTTRGYELELTRNHRVVRVGEGGEEWVEAGSLQPGDKVKISNHRSALGWSGGDGTFDQGYLLGHLVGDGTFTMASTPNKNHRANLDLWGEPDRAELIHTILNRTVKRRSEGSIFYDEKRDRYRISSTGLSELAAEYGIFPCDKTPNERMESSSFEMQRGFLKGLFDCDGSPQGSQSKGTSIRLSQANLPRLKMVQRMLLHMGIASTLYKQRQPKGWVSPLPDGKGGLKDYLCEATHELVIANDNIQRYEEVIGFYCKHKKDRLSQITSSYKRTLNKETFVAELKSLEMVGIKAVYDVCVPGPESFCANGIIAHNCFEISLPDNGFCNLAEIATADVYDQSDLNHRAAMAARIATLQATHTDFHFLRPEWERNALRDALIGVSMTGIAGGGVMDLDLKEAADHVLSENLRMAHALGINPAKRATTIKPSGTTSLVLGCSAGVHAYWDEYYIRRITINKTESIYPLLMGVVPELMEDCKFNGDRDAKLSFPMKAPRGAVLRHEAALDTLERVRQLHREWIVPGHREGANTNNVSCTIQVKDHEWDEVGEWMETHRDEYASIAVLPYDGGTYVQAPHESIDKDTYEAMASHIKHLDLTELVEEDDFTDLQGEAACAGGACTVV